MTAEVALPLARYAPFRRAGDLVLFAGIVAADPTRGIVIKGYADLPPDMRKRAGETGEMSVDTKDGPIAAQSWYILEQLRRTVATAGGTLSDVVKLTQYFRDLRDFPAYNRIRSQFFAEPPASTVVRVLELLPTPDSLLEVDAIAHIPEKGGEASSMNLAESDSLKHVQYFRAPDDRRPVAIFISGQFDEFEKFPPFMETEKEIRHVREAYKIADPLLERTTKAHITDNSWPLQIILLERNPGGTTLPHYHVPTEALPELPTRHQILVCQSGKARVGIFTRQGQALGEVVMRPNDLVLLLEGHEVEFLERGTRLVEVKQGPFPGSDADDKIDLKVSGK